MGLKKAITHGDFERRLLLIILIVIVPEENGNYVSHEYMSPNITKVNTLFHRKYHRNVINNVFEY